jgi:ribosomal protein S14
MNLTKRLDRLERALPQRAVCSACGDRGATVVIQEYPGQEPVVSSDNRCPVCGSPDAVTVHVEFVDVQDMRSDP